MNKKPSLIERVFPLQSNFGSL